MTRYLGSSLSLLLVFILMASTAMAQSEKEGWTLYNQADKLRKEAKSKDDFTKAQEKFEQALRIFRFLCNAQGFFIVFERFLIFT